MKIRGEVEIKSASLSILGGESLNQHSDEKDKRKSHISNSDAILYSVLTTITAKADIRTDSIKVDAGIQSLSVLDKYTPNPQYSHIITTKSTNTKNSNNKTTDLLSVFFEQNPLDNHADIVLRVAMAPLVILVNPNFIQRLGKGYLHLIVEFSHTFFHICICSCSEIL